MSKQKTGNKRRAVFEDIRSVKGRKDRRGAKSQENPKRTFHKVTCSKCKKRCEVPFKPTSGKPVLCSSCFNEEKPESNDGLKEINEKLDKIMNFLNI